MRTGPRYAALPPGCPIDFVENKGDLAPSDYEVLGTTIMMGVDTFTDSAKADLQSLACEWGGTTVTIASTVNPSPMHPVQTTFSIQRKRAEEQKAVPLACVGVYTNSDGASLEFSTDGTTKMSFQGNVSECAASSRGGSQVTMTCGGMAQDGSFNSGCEAVEFGGMTYSKVN